MLKETLFAKSIAAPTDTVNKHLKAPLSGVGFFWWRGGGHCPRTWVRRLRGRCQNSETRWTGRGASHFLWSGGNTTNPPIEEVGPMFVFNTAFDGKQRAGTRFRPETPNPSQPRKMGCTRLDAPRFSSSTRSDICPSRRAVQASSSRSSTRVTKKEP